MSEPKRIYFAYRHVDKPWGGANNFIRALHNAVAGSERFEILQTPSPDDCDILFMGQLGRGPAGGSGHYSLDEVKSMLGSKAQLVVRAVNLRRNFPGYDIRSFINPRRIRNGISEIKRDKQTLALLHMADHVIFQSNWQKDMFIQYDFKGKTWSVVHNGASKEFLPIQPSALPVTDKLRLLSCGVSARLSKNHNLIAEISKLKSVEVHYTGNWPDTIDPVNVRFHGVIAHNELAELWNTMHYCFHPAVEDPCPNAVCEALACGVPVIYNPKPGGTVELASSSGVALQEDNIEATIQEARLHYNENVQKARDSSAYYTIDRACREYIEIMRNIL